MVIEITALVQSAGNRMSDAEKDEMKPDSLLRTSGALTLTALSAFALAACRHARNADTSSVPVTAPVIGAAGGSTEGPKVPFGNQPCRSLTPAELKDLGIAKPAPAKPEPGHEPDSLAFDNTCDFGYQTLVYTTESNYDDQRNDLRNPRHNAPKDLPGAFYDVLGNLWFAKKGYYVTLPNTTADAVKEKVARTVAAKL